MRRLWWSMVEPKVQLIRAPCSQLQVDYTFTMRDNNDRRTINNKGLSHSCQMKCLIMTVLVGGTRMKVI